MQSPEAGTSVAKTPMVTGCYEGGSEWLFFSLAEEEDERKKKEGLRSENERREEKMFLGRFI